MDEGKTLGATAELRVFTHPACPGCATAVKEAWNFGQGHPGVVVRTVSLEQEKGLAEARAESVRTIPTVILASGDGESRRWSGTPGSAALEEALAELATAN